jgi:molybdopterin/thiamine biosynthesis adenylyltransferase
MNADERGGGGLHPDELDRYSWQQSVAGFGADGQRRLKSAAVLVSRVGGVGGAAATYLAAAGVGRLVLAHAGNLRRNDLNRQTLMSTPGIGRPRVEQAAERLRGLNPHVVVETVPENATADNAARLVARCDLVVSAAPLFAERLILNAEAVRQGRPLVDAAMYDAEARLMSVLPGGPCLACLYPAPPPHWRREFPVLGAVAGSVGALAALEAIKILTGCGPALAGRLWTFDTAAMTCRTLTIPARRECPVCGPRGRM